MSEICAGDGEPGLVSVVIPTYNRAYILSDTIDSVLAQTYSPIEVVVVDDGSTDDTRRLVERYGVPVRYIYQTNQGVAAARNRAFRAVRGEFIALIDSDDRWCSWKLELQIAFLRRHPEVGMVWTDMAAIDTDGVRVDDSYLRKFYRAYEDVSIEDIMTQVESVGELGVALPPEYAGRSAWVGDIFSPLIHGTLVHTPTTVLRRERVRGTGGYDESLRPTGEDFDFHLRTAVQGPVGFLDVPAIDYRIGGEDQLTAPSYALAMARNYFRTLESWLARERARITLPAAELRGILAYAHEWVGAQELLAGSRAAARTHLWQSVQRAPLNVKTWGLYAFALLPPQLLAAVRRARRRRRQAGGTE